ncbi:MAG: hypothetical protein JST89_25870 [Cyanobacteria bacterium SZAS-4]|nr:hypothetical protein [Cyanobacteria bacterium SZAS-4]
MTNKQALSTDCDGVYFSTSLIDYTEFLEAMDQLCEDPGSQYAPAFILRQLLQCCDTEMLIDIVDNPKTCQKILEGLSKIQNLDVRFAMAENHNLDFNILSNLADDENPYVAMRAQQTVERLKSISIGETVLTLNVPSRISRQVS